MEAPGASGAGLKLACPWHRLELPHRALPCPMPGCPLGTDATVVTTEDTPEPGHLPRVRRWYRQPLGDGLYVWEELPDLM